MLKETIPLKAVSQLKSLKLLSDKNLTLLKIDYSIELNKMGRGYILIANLKENNISYIARSNLESVKAGELIKNVTNALGGKGGGSPTFAQGGSPLSDKLDEVLSNIEATIDE